VLNELCSCLVCLQNCMSHHTKSWSYWFLFLKPNSQILKDNCPVREKKGWQFCETLRKINVMIWMTCYNMCKNAQGKSYLLERGHELVRVAQVLKVQFLPAKSSHNKHHWLAVSTTTRQHHHITTQQCDNIVTWSQ
jgi:hypothetical protein